MGLGGYSFNSKFSHRNCNYIIIISGVVLKKSSSFRQCIYGRTAEWSKLSSSRGPTITDRYSHVACYHGKSLYVFGGYASTNTTFNDLWRLDLATRQWVRPLAMGMSQKNHNDINFTFV